MTTSSVSSFQGPVADQFPILGCFSSEFIYLHSLPARSASASIGGVVIPVKGGRLFLI